ncbi:ABC transporter substrate-binding protein [Agrobacterium vitis]|uniref:ABC transporter substrate-binding protein n=1 Tax=Allorhizobium ampelinum TaxID=3025782 RepID=UPI001F16882D|nr:ABC transporter substrate-binding protein [Allorhizobium ampelinum]MCF1474410.1 ABC transporter substrate-binding protein [Allorhizobium ampelinum]
MAFRIITAVSAFALMTLSAASGLAAGDPLAAPPTERTDTKTIIIGSADFPESQLLATLYAKALAAKGIKVETKLNIGSREVYMPALLDGSIDLLPEYAGAALSYLDKKATAHTPDDVAAALKAALPKGVSMLTPSAAQDSDGVAVTRATAEKYKLKTIADLAPVASEFVLGGPPEWKTRKEGIIGLKEVYGLEFKSLKALDVGGPLTLSALVNGQIQAANLFSTDPAIATNDLVMLEDVKNLFPAQNVVPVIATAKVSETVAKTLDAVSAALTTKDLVVMNGRLGNHDSFDVVAGDWLAQHKLN